MTDGWIERGRTPFARRALDRHASATPDRAGPGPATRFGDGDRNGTFGRME